MSTNLHVLASLESLSGSKGQDVLAAKLAELRAWLAADLVDVERALGEVGKDGDTLAHKGARHLLDRGGKRIRPICVALASHVGLGFTPRAREYAIAVELVHNATLLHDDVVDLGDKRRGADTARVVYGNAASIFAGDWMLIDALCRIQAAGIPAVLEKGLEVIRAMVVAETMQLENRGRVRSGIDDYFRIVEGKTASLFRWAMYAGGRAGEVDEQSLGALETYGQKLGVAFQLVDDVLDVAGDPQATGKTLLADLREGKMTYPLLLAMERDAELTPILEDFCAADDVALDPGVAVRVARTMGASRVVEDCLDLAQKLCDEAVACLAPVPEGAVKSALVGVALATPRRRR